MKDYKTRIHTLKEFQNEIIQMKSFQRLSQEDQFAILKNIENLYKKLPITTYINKEVKE